MHPPAAAGASVECRHALGRRARADRWRAPVSRASAAGARGVLALVSSIQLSSGKGIQPILTGAPPSVNGAADWRAPPSRPPSMR